jgi:hypothetical protein
MTNCRGKSHMVLVSDSPGDCHGALGVVTLEDVIEELIGEEIIDETDVFVDVSRHLKRMSPASAFAHHSFHRISSRQGRQHSGDGMTPILSPGSFPTNVSKGTVKPLNKANEPKPTTSTKVTIKPGTEARNVQHVATIVSQEERLLGKKVARENYGTISAGDTVDGDEAGRTRSSAALIEERVTVSENRENGKVLINPVKDPIDDEDDDTRPLL